MRNSLIALAGIQRSSSSQIVFVSADKTASHSSISKSVRSSAAFPSSHYSICSSSFPLFLQKEAEEELLKLAAHKIAKTMLDKYWEGESKGKAGVDWDCSYGASSSFPKVSAW